MSLACKRAQRKKINDSRSNISTIEVNLSQFDVEILHSMQQLSTSKLRGEHLCFLWEQVPHSNCSTSVGAPLRLVLDSAENGQE